LEVKFNDNKIRQVDFNPILEGSLYKDLRDLRFFNRVKIDPEVHTLVWPNGVDFDPASLHEWPDFLRHFAAVTKKWSRKRV